MIGVKGDSWCALLGFRQQIVMGFLVAEDPRADTYGSGETHALLARLDHVKLLIGS